MTIESLKEMKKKLKLTNAQISQRSGIPLGTVNKIFSGATKSPQYDSVQAIERVIREAIGIQQYSCEETQPVGMVREEAPLYGSMSCHTVEDYEALPEDIRVELIDGVFYDMASPGMNHQILVSQLFMELSLYIREQKGLCRVLFAPLDVWLDQDDYTMVQPDLVIVCDPEKLSPKRVNGAPDFIIEVTSPGSRRMDSIKKMQKYADAGVREYWIVDPIREKVVVYRFEQDDIPCIYHFTDRIPVGIYEGLEIDMGEVSSALLPES